MLVKNSQPCARAIGNLVLVPGWNKVPDERWDVLAKSKQWAKPIKGLVEDGILELTDSREKLTIEIVKQTNDVDMLEAWLSDPAHKGPLKGAIKKQLAKMELKPKDSEGDEDLL